MKLNFINANWVPLLREPSQQFNQRTRETMRCGISPPARRKPVQILSDESKHHILEAHLLTAAPTDERSKQLALLVSVLDQSAQERQHIGAPSLVQAGLQRSA
ncbi:hypothetical protein XH99_28220 [Bradyrhizobium nanningense]|uniref:Uncharacterized protein n=1 Tax=Bradyrhizobium nanningense TaxID=1325118 RepID=A0A4Q0RXA2_9BRAD|nr:hypothetical protein [Bradyrhizobium nanningense]RXH24600.1 hypothetical protein XH99_28220 [Bradyrhizobium nanningense]RXH30582.1 hypothetical protein XH84_18855 [Bradyrhizobium nanningense]